MYVIYVYILHIIKYKNVLLSVTCNRIYRTKAFTIFKIHETCNEVNWIK